MGSSDPISWPPCSPDLKPCHYFLWGCLKNIVYGEPPNKILEIEIRIKRPGASIDRNISMKVYENLETRLCSVLKEGRGHFEDTISYKNTHIAGTDMHH